MPTPIDDDSPIVVLIESEPQVAVVEGAFGGQGVQGVQGPPGVGLPVGGNVGDALVKAGTADYSASWQDFDLRYYRETEADTLFHQKSLGVIRAVVAPGSSISSGTLSFHNGNGVSFGLSNNSLTASHNGLTSQSAQVLSWSNGSETFQTINLGTINGLTLYGSNGSLVGSYTVPTQSVVPGIQSVSAGTTLITTGQVNFLDSNGISFGASAQTITASHNGLTAGIQSVSGGTTRATNGELVFSNSNGLSFGVNGQTITASHNALTTQMNQVVSGSNGTLGFETLSLGSSNGLHFYTTNGSLVGSYTVPTQSTQPGLQSASAGTTRITTGEVVFSNSNGVSFGANGQTITASHNGLTTAALSNHSHGASAANGSFGFQTLSFSNANGVSFGTSAGSAITASINAPAQSNQTLGLYAVSNSTGQSSSSTFDARTISFHAAGIASVGYSNGSVVISVPAGGGVGDGVNILAAGTQTAATTGTVLFSDSNGITFGMSNSSVITASHNGITQQSTQPVALSGSNGSFTFSTATFGSSNGLHFYTTNGSVVGSYTSPVVSNAIQAVGSATGSGTNTSRFAPDDHVHEGVFSMGVSTAGNTLNNTRVGPGRFVLQGGPNITLSQITAAGALNTIVFSGGAGGAGNTGSISAGTTRGTLGEVVFSNSNGVSFGIDGQTVTASHNGITQQSTQPVALSGSNGSFAFSTATFGNSNGLSFYTTNGSMVGSYTVPTVPAQFSGGNSNLGNTAGDTGVVTGRLVLVGTNNITLSGSTNGGSMTISISGGAGAAGNTGYISAGTTNASLGTLSIANGNGVSFGIDGQTLTATVKTDYLTSQSNQALSGSNGSFTFQTATFGNSNGLSFYTTNGSMVGSYTVPTQTVQPVALSGSNGSFNFSTATFGNSNGLSFYTTNGSMVGSYTVPNTAGLISAVNFSAGTTSGNVSAVTFSNSNGVSFGYNGGTITASVAAPPADQTGISGIVVSNTTYTSGTVSFSNANGISFGSSAGQAITASYTVPTVPAQFSGGNSNLGNTAGDTGVVTGRLVLVGTNNITLSGSTNGGSMTISISGGAGAAGNTGYISAGTTNASLGTVSFSNANGVSFGIDGQTLTASISTSLTNIRVSAGTTSNLLSALTFADGNGVSFGINASTITATVKTDYLTSQSNQALSGSNGSFTFQTATFGNSNGLSFYTTNGSMVGSYTVPTQSNQTVGGYFVGNTTGQSSSSTWDARTISFDGAGIVSIGASAGSIRISATQSNQAFSADASSTFQTLTLQNSNGISFSNNAGAIRLTHDLQFTSNTSAITSAALHTSVGGRIYVTAQSTGQSSSSSYDLRTLSIVPDGIISAGWSNGSFRISATQSNQAFSAGAASSTFQTLSFQDSNGISFSNNAGAIRASYTRNVASNAIQSVGSATNSGTNTSRFAADDHVHAGVFSMGVSTGGNTAGDTRVDVGRFVLQGGNNITLSQVTAANALNTIVVSAGAGGGNTNMTAYATGNTTQSSTGTIAFSSYIFRGSNNVSVGVSNGSVVIDATQSNPAVSNSAGSFTFQTLNFSNANNVTWGTSAGGIVTASVAAPGAAAENNWMHALGANTAGNTTASGSTIGLSGINLTISGTNASVFNLSVPATSSLSATGMVSISTNGSTISIGVPSRTTLSGWDPFEDREHLAIAGGQGTLWMQPLDVMAPVQFDNFGLRVTLSNATNSSGSLTVSVWAGLYTRNASTLSLASSTSFTRGATMSGTAGSYSQYGGMKILTGAWTVTMPAGNYWMGVISRTTTGGANMTVGNLGVSQIASTYSGFFGGGSATSNQRRLGAGIYSATTSALPASINFNAIQGGSSAFNRPPAFLFMSNTY